MSFGSLLISVSAFLITSSLQVVSAKAATNQDRMLVNQTMSQTFIDGLPQERHVGVVQVDTVKKQIRLQVYEDPCGSMTAERGSNFCLATPFLIETLVVPLQTSDSNCGSVSYSGVVDGTGRDLPYYEVEVIDHSKRTCKDNLRSVYEVNASVINVRDHETKTYLLLK